MIASSFESVISDVVRVVESVGAAIMVLGGGAALVVAVPRIFRADSRQASYEILRRDLGQAILLGLEVLIVADIIRTILVDATVESVFVLGIIVLIRILLSFSLDVEIEGAWPWQRWKLIQSREREHSQGGSADPQS
jgi:uncharacterized membrane protein